MTEKQTLFFNRLKQNVAAQDYETWVRERDYPTARALPAITRYEILRLTEPVRSGGIDVPADYLEVVTVTSFEEYDEQLQGMPDRETFLAELRTYVDCVLAVRSETV